MASLSSKNQTALVVGGTDGVGKEVARGLLRQGMNVIVVGRDIAKGARAFGDLGAAPSHLHFLACDLSEMRQVQSLAKLLSDRWPAIHRLILCAGMVRGRYSLTAEGIETNFAVNYLWRFVLIESLTPLLRAMSTGGGIVRIVLVGGAAQNGTIFFENINLEGAFSTFRAVSQFCAANDVFTIELARRLRESGGADHIHVNCIKLGAVKTGIRRQFPLWMKILVPLLIDPFITITAREAAEPVLSLALDPMFENVTGRLYRKIRKFRPLDAGADIASPATGARLWQLSEQLATRARPNAGPQVRTEADAKKTTHIVQP